MARPPCCSRSGRSAPHRRTTVNGKTLRFDHGPANGSVAALSRRYSDALRTRKIVESPRGVAPLGAPRSVREPLDSYGSRCSAVSKACLLYTTGFVPFLRTYPGARIPQPTEVLEHFGDSPWDKVLTELLAMTKLNWNTADFAARYPITLAFSSRVGEILAEIPDDAPIRQEYRM